MRSQVQPRPGKFPFRPELGAALSSGSPGPSARDPRGRGGEHSAILKLFASSCPLKVLRPCTPRPRPTPLSASPFGAANSSRLPTSPPGWGEGLCFRLGKVFKGFFLALLVSDWAFRGGKGGGKFRWCFSCTVFQYLLFLALTPQSGGVIFRFSAHPHFFTDSFGSRIPLLDSSGREGVAGSSEETVSARGRTRQDFWSSPQCRSFPSDSVTVR